MQAVLLFSSNSPLAALLRANSKLPRLAGTQQVGSLLQAKHQTQHFCRTQHSFWRALVICVTEHPS